MAGPSSGVGDAAGRNFPVQWRDIFDEVCRLCYEPIGYIILIILLAGAAAQDSGRPGRPGISDPFRSEQCSNLWHFDHPDTGVQRCVYRGFSLVRAASARARYDRYGDELLG